MGRYIGRWSPVPTAVPIPPSILKAVLARLSVWFSAALRPKQPDQQPPLPPVAVRLCQLPPRRQPPQTHGRPHAQYACASGSRTYKGKRSRDCDRTSRPQTLAGLSPLAPQGENNHPGEGVPVRASLPRIRRHNIIPSELCNSRRHRQCPASRESVKHTPGARKTVLQGVRLHNSDYVKEAPASRCEGPTFELPGEAASDKQPPSRTSGLQARQGAAHFLGPSWQRHQDSGSATPAVGTAACDFRLVARIKGRRYARPESAVTSTVRALRVGCSLAASVRCEESAALCATGAGRTSPKHLLC